MTIFLAICMTMVVVGLILTVTPSFYIKYPWVFTALFFIATILVIIYANIYS
jgi:hypothetical protein